MRLRSTALLIALAMCVSAQTQESKDNKEAKATSVAAASTTSAPELADGAKAGFSRPKVEPINLTKLDLEDQKALDQFQKMLDNLTPQLTAAQRQAEQAKAAYDAAQVVISNYNGVQASRQAVFYHICLKLKLDPDEYEFTPDGRG